MAPGHKLIDDAPFDPDTIKMMGEVFVAAWGKLVPAFRGLPLATIDNARTVLASNIIQGVRCSRRL